MNKENIRKEVETGEGYFDLESAGKLKKSVVIVDADGKRGTAFFLKFPLFDEEIKFLVTNNHVIGQGMIKLQSTFTLEYDEEKEKTKIKLTNKRRIFTFDEREEDVTLIEILENDKIDDDLFLEIDSDYFINGINSYINRPIMVFEHPKGGNLKIALGIIITIDKENDYIFSHSAKTQEGSSGSPILLSNLKVIGIHWGGEKNEKKNYGTFIGKIVEKLNIKKISYENGDKYEGEMKDEKKEGKGTLNYINGDKYDGQWKDDKREGQGICIYNNGKRYIGQWKKDKPEGKGVMIHKNGDKYEGEIKDGKAEGYGIYYYAGGDKYDGEWKNNYQEGHGIYHYANGDKYDGEFKNNKPEGHGIVTLSNGEKYDGELKNGLYEGHGIYTYDNGEKYDGEWKNDKKEGHGIYTYVNGAKYVGEWKNDKKEGHGTLFNADGSINYRGEWKNDSSGCSIF